MWDLDDIKVDLFALKPIVSKTQEISRKPLHLSIHPLGFRRILYNLVYLMGQIRKALRGHGSRNNIDE